MKKILSRKKIITIAQEVEKSLKDYISELGDQKWTELKMAINHNFEVTTINDVIKNDYCTIYYDIWLHLLSLMKPLYSFSDKYGFPIAKWLYDIYDCDYNITSGDFLRNYILETDGVLMRYIRMHEKGLITNEQFQAKLTSIYKSRTNT